MSLLEAMTEDMKASMKAKDSATLSTLRLLLSACKNKKIELLHELSDAEVQDVVKTQVKQLKDSIVSFDAGGRADMAQSARAEIAVLEKYLPVQMSEEDLRALVQKTIAETGAASQADMGRVMGATLKAAQGQADGARVKGIVMQLLPAVVLVLVGTSTAYQPALAAIPLVAEDFGLDASTIEMALRLFRVLILWLGIPAITLMLTGGFGYMTASSRDELHTEAWGKMAQGFFATIIVAGLFAISTIILQQL
ncbi:GatB/YqeY domain-containing protein [Candidatus Uhrbacteria bacterium]|nr:GatB/YqeY domain-containing protein [Candidatus Uhrbacteria bacterium]